MLKDDRFDIISFFDVIEHIHVGEISCFLNKVSSLLLPGGYLIGNTPNIQSLNIKLCGCMDPAIWPPSHVSYYSMESLDIELKKFGYKKIFSLTEGFVPFRKNKKVESFITHPRTFGQIVASLPLKVIIKLVGKMLRFTRSGYQIYFAFTVAANAD